MFLSDTLQLCTNRYRDTGDTSKHGDIGHDSSKHGDSGHDLSKHVDSGQDLYEVRPIKVENDPDTVDHKVPTITTLVKKKTSDPREFFEKLYGPDPPKDDARGDPPSLTMGDHPNLVYPLPTTPSLLHHSNISLPWPGGLQAFCEYLLSSLRCTSASHNREIHINSYIV